MELIKIMSKTVFTSTPIDKFSSYSNSYRVVGEDEDRFITAVDKNAYDEIYVLIGNEKVIIK